MGQQTENTTLLRLQSAETSYINHILKGIDDLLQYRGAQMPVEILLEWEDALHAANDAVAKFADDQTKEKALLDYEYLRNTGEDIHRIVAFLTGIFDEYRKLEIIREVIKETA
ncbi:MAG: hypothetical protein LBG17_05905 [Bacteroidales bacterium]|jgi:hypothetical protein|nr:hypothetical protein [Bacteroidales bacterium]